MSATPEREPALTIVIATRGRRDSLLETLDALGPASLPPGARIVVVDNAPAPELDPAQLEDAGAGRLRVLHEPQPGKWRCLNTAIEDGLGDGSLGELIAVLDDDMAPMPGWAGAVIESARARPQYDLFTGKSHVVWPQGVAEPAWAGHWLARGVCFSVVCWEGDGELEMGRPFEHPSGNHFWFRRRVLHSVPAFAPGWTSEAQWCMEARSRGHRGLLVPGVTCGHRVQPGLAEAEVFLARARGFGHALGRIERTSERMGGLGPAERLVRRGKSVAAIAVWTVRERRARALPREAGVPERARALLRLGRHRALLGAEGPPAHLP